MPFFWNNEGLNPNAVVGSSRRNLAFTSVLSNGTTMVSVFCPSPHGLTRLDIIAIYGLSDINANGFYYVSEVTSDTSFTYETLYPAIGGPLQTENTILFNANIGVPYGYIKVPYIASSVGYPPVNTIPPVITDTCVNTGTWTGTQPIIYTYQWYLDGVAISGATAQCSVTGNSVVVTATNSFGSTSITVYSSNTISSPLLEIVFSAEVFDETFQLSSLCTDSLGSIYVWGRCPDSILVGAYIAKINWQINPMVWEKTFAHNSNVDPTFNPQSITFDGNNYLYTAGYSSPDNNNGVLQKWDLNGNLITQVIAQLSQSEFYKVIVDNNSSCIYIIGLSYASPNNSVLVIKTDLNLNTIWAKKYTNTSVYENYIDRDFIIRSADIDNSGNLLIAASTNFVNPLNDGVSPGCAVFKISPSGSILWVYGYADNTASEASSIYPSIKIDSFGDIIVSFVTTFFVEFASEHAVARVLKLNSDGTLIWNTKLYEVDSDRMYAYDIATDNEGKIFIVGEANKYIDSTTDTRSYGFVTAIDIDGNILWSRKIDFVSGTSYRFISVNSVCVDVDGYINIIGYFYCDQPNQGTQFIGKLRPDGEVQFISTDTLNRQITYLAAPDIQQSSSVVDQFEFSNSNTSLSLLFSNTFYEAADYSATPGTRTVEFVPNSP